MHLLLIKQKSHTTDFLCPPLRNLINASALQSFPSLSPFFAPHSLRLLFHLSFSGILHISFPYIFPGFCIFTFPYIFSGFCIFRFFTLSRRIWLPHIFPSFAYSLSIHQLFPGFCIFHFIHFFPGFVYHCFFRCRKCFLTPSASPLSAPCLPYPVFPLFFLPCLSASLLSDSFLPFLRQKHIR